MLSPDKIESFYVYNWQQKTVNDFDKSVTPKTETVDELLVKTNKTNFLSSAVTTSNLPSQYGYLTTATPKDKIDFSLPAKSTTRLYFKFKSPEVSGTYNGRVVIWDTKNNQNIAQFLVVINAIDKTLPQVETNNYKFGCYVNDRILKDGIKAPSSTPENFISADLFTKRMTAVKDMGCNALVLRVSKATDTVAMIKAAQTLKFSKGVWLEFRYLNSDNNEIKYKTLDVSNKDAVAQFKVLVREILNAELADKTINIPISFYGIDEANGRGAAADKDQNTENYILQVKNMLNYLGEEENAIPAPNQGFNGSFTKDITAAMQPATYNYLMTNEDIRLHTNAPILNYYTPCNANMPGYDSCTTTKDLVSSYAADPASVPTKSTYYFQATREQPLINRYLGGLGLVASKFKGYYLNVVSGFVAQADKSATLFSEDKLVGAQKQNMLMYPASDGFIPTVQSESIRSGILDIKYYFAYGQIAENFKTTCTTKESYDSVLSWVQKIGGWTNQSPTSTSLTASDIVANRYGLPTKDLEMMRNNMEMLFATYSDKCGRPTLPSVK